MLRKLTLFEFVLLLIFVVSSLKSVFNWWMYMSAFMDFILLIFCLINKDFYKGDISKIFFILLLCCVSLFIYDLSSSITLFYLFVGLLSCEYLANKYIIRKEFIYRLFLYVCIPVSLLSFILGPYSSIENTNPLSYIPVSNNEWKINVLSWGATIHGTSLIGLLIFLVSLYNIGVLQKDKWIDNIFLVLGVYFVVFSGSRGGYITFFLILILFYINRKRIYVFYSCFILLTTIVVTYSMELLHDYVNISSTSQLVNSLLKLDYWDSTSGITSGRSWLWAYHWNLLVGSHYLGVGKDGIDIKLGELTNTGEIAPGATESPATFLLAAYGPLGVILISIYFYMFLKALRKQKIFAILLMAMAISLLIGSGINMFVFIDPYSMLFLLLYFNSMKNSNCLNLKICV